MLSSPHYSLYHWLRLAGDHAILTPLLYHWLRLAGDHAILTPLLSLPLVEARR